MAGLRRGSQNPRWDDVTCEGATLPETVAAMVSCLEATAQLVFTACRLSGGFDLILK